MKSLLKGWRKTSRWKAYWNDEEKLAYENKKLTERGVAQHHARYRYCLDNYYLFIWKKTNNILTIYLTSSQEMYLYVQKFLLSLIAVLANWSLHVSLELSLSHSIALSLSYIYFYLSIYESIILSYTLTLFFSLYF